MCDFIGLTNKKNKTKNYRFTSPNQNVDIGDFFFHAHETGKPKFEGARKQKKNRKKTFFSAQKTSGRFVFRPQKTEHNVSTQ